MVMGLVSGDRQNRVQMASSPSLAKWCWLCLQSIYRMPARHEVRGAVVNGLICPLSFWSSESREIRYQQNKYKIFAVYLRGKCYEGNVRGLGEIVAERGTSLF